MSVDSWIGIAICIAHAATFSGLNLAVFSISRLRLEVAAAGGDAHARTLLALRQDSNFTLATILWGNTAANVMLTLLSHSVLAGLASFAFSTVAITLLCEIVPQAYFSRHALGSAARLSPILKIYGFLLFPVAKPTALLLDAWLGPETITYFRERDFRALIAQHVKAALPEVGAVEGTGALNFLDLDDVPIGQEGEALDPLSVIEVSSQDSVPVFPRFEGVASDPFLQKLQRSGRKWVIFTDASGQPLAVLNAHRFLRRALFGAPGPKIEAFLHRPIVTTDPRTPLGNLLGRLHVRARTEHDDVVDQDVLLLWGPHRRIVTGADLLGRLLRGIAQRDAARVRRPGASDTQSAKTEPPNTR